jgi:hypothetical protein
VAGLQSILASSIWPVAMIARSARCLSRYLRRAPATRPASPRIVASSVWSLPRTAMESGTAQLPSGASCASAGALAAARHSSARDSRDMAIIYTKAPAGFRVPAGAIRCYCLMLGRLDDDAGSQAFVELVSTRNSSFVLSADTSTSISSPFAKSPTRIFSESGSSMKR